ncbi:MAG: putative permease [Clostridia bacterium]|jgi:predicted permease|nr:putative permease [Clostridia bacterium]
MSSIILISKVLELFIMTAIGYYSAKKQLMDRQFNRQLAKLLIQVIFPIAMLYNGYQNFGETEISNIVGLLTIPILLIIIGYVLVTFITYYLPLEKEKIGIFRAACIFSNTIFIGLPIAETLLGSTSTSYVMLYYVCNTCLFWIIGVRGFVKEKKQDKKNIGRFFPMPVRGFFIGVLLVLLGIKLPSFIHDPIAKINSAATPLSMIYIGAMMYFTDYKSLSIDRHIGGVMLGKLVIYPTIVVGMLKYCPILNAIPSLASATFALLAAMPVINQLPIVAGQYHVEEEYSNTIGILTTMCAVIWVPIAGIIIKIIFGV